MVKPKHYYYDKIWNRYRVMKSAGNGKRISYGSYATEKDAEKVVAELKKVDWDKKQLPSILKKLGIKSKIKVEG